MTEFGAVEVSVSGEVPVRGGGTDRARAAAHWGLDLADCQGDPLFDVATVVAGTPTPTWMDCGPYRIHLLHDGLRFKLQPWGQVKQHLEPRLTD